MSGKSFQYWDARWDAEEGTDFDKAKALLCEYCACFKSNCCLPKIWGGSIGRFFSGRWNTHHGDAVQESLKILQTDTHKETQTIDNLFCLLKDSLHGAKLKFEGDLQTIISVIEIKTNTSFDKVDPKTYRHSINLSEINLSNTL